jgi:hypothetical protein
VEIQTADAVRLYGDNAIWKDVAQRLLDNTCQPEDTKKTDAGRGLTCPRGRWAAKLERSMATRKAG